MERAPKADMDAAKVALFDYDEPALETVDRSTLERAAVCPFQARAVTDGRCKTVGILAEAGEAAHQAFSDVLHSWIDSHGAMSKTDLRQDLEFAVRQARPDLQPEAIKAIQGAIWSWTSLVYAIHPGNILAFDGGEDLGKSGQLAVDFPDLGVRYTSEIDLLYQSNTEGVLDEVDYKTGWKEYDESDIEASFQFQSHAVMVLEKYRDPAKPDNEQAIQALRVRVFNTRRRSLTYPVIFPRSRLFDWQTRIRSAVSAWRASQGDNPPTWPLTEKCCICPAAAICPVADRPYLELSSPPDFLRSMAAIKARLDAMETIAASWVDAFGRDMEAGPMRYGRRKPPTNRKSPASFYEVKGKGGE